LRNVALAVSLWAGVAHAAALVYVSDGSTLYQLDGSSGAVQSSVSLSISGLTGLAFNQSGALWGIFSVGNGQIGTIDPTTGAVTPLPGTLGGVPIGLAFDSSNNAFTSVNYRFRGIDTVTGALSGVIFSDTSAASGDFSFAPDGSIWYPSPCGLQRATASLGSGSGSGAGGCGSGGVGSGIPPPVFNGVYNFNSSFYGILTVGGDLSLVTFSDATFTPNPVLTNIGGLPGNVTSIAVQGAAPTFTPEPQAVALAGLGLAGMAGFQFYRRRRR